MCKDACQKLCQNKDEITQCPFRQIALQKKAALEEKKKNHLNSMATQIGDEAATSAIFKKTSVTAIPGMIIPGIL